MCRSLCLGWGGATIGRDAKRWAVDWPSAEQNNMRYESQSLSVALSDHAYDVGPVIIQFMLMTSWDLVTAEPATIGG